MKKKNAKWDYSLRIIAFIAVTMLFIITCDDGKEVDNSQYYFDPPTGIVATILSDVRTIHLTWDEVSNAGRYEVSFRTNLDSADTRRNLSAYVSITRYEHSYYSWYVTADVDTLYYYVKTHPSKSGYIASRWSDPVSVTIR